jgi:hypothetical protein
MADFRACAMCARINQLPMERIMGRMKGLHFTVWMFAALMHLQMPVPAWATPAEIAARCADEWGTDYEMQLWCRKKQIEALEQLQGMDNQTKIGAAPAGQTANDGRPVIWEPYTTRAIKITGAIRTSESAIDFQNGERIEIKLVPGGKSEHRRMFKVTGNTNPPLIYGNRLCPDNERLSYVITDTSGSSYGMLLSIYCNMPKPPFGDFKWGVGGDYGYSKAIEQDSWKPSVNIDERHTVEAIEGYCSEFANYDSDPLKWRKCIDGEMTALQRIREILEIRS